MDELRKGEHDLVVEKTQPFGRQGELAFEHDEETRIELPLAAGLAFGRFSRWRRRAGSGRDAGRGAVEFIAESLADQEADGEGEQDEAAISSMCSWDLFISLSKLRRLFRSRKVSSIFMRAA